MKKLEELGISPAPWSKIFDEFGDEESEYQVAVADARFPVGAVTLSGDYCEADANLIAAAPDMYAAIWDIIFKCTKITNCRNCKGAELGNCKACPLGKARAALAKASGESEVAK